jgi:type II secretory pathway pseudopilin PulG
MCGRGKLTPLERNSGKHRESAFTLTEVVVASSLLIVAIVPILRALTAAHLNSIIIERKTRCLSLAQAQLDEIKARSIYSYSDSFAATDEVLEGSYLADITDSSISSNLRRIVISVGHDTNEDSQLEADETHVTLDTYIAKRW